MIRLTVLAAVILWALASSAAPARAEGGAASATAAVRIVAGSLQLQAEPLVIESDGTTATGTFTVTNPGQSAAWFLVVGDQRVGWAPAGSGGGQFQVSSDLAMPTPGADLTASLTSGP